VTGEFANPDADVINFRVGAFTWTSWWLPCFHRDDGNAAALETGHALPQAHEVDHRPQPERCRAHDR
jgi:hypothetical protein